MQRNIRLYPWFRAASDGHAWITVFFLYMSQKLPLDQVIELSAVYYLSVFVLEVPSGYFSDRIGRRRTLLIAAAALIVSTAALSLAPDSGGSPPASFCWRWGSRCNPEPIPHSSTIR